MNNKRRAVLKQAINYIRDAEGNIDSALDEERDCLSNMPESLESSDRYEKMEEAVSKLEDAMDSIGDLIGLIEDAME